MLLVGLALFAAGALAAFVYLRRERLGRAGVALAGLRTIGVGALLLLLLNPSGLWRRAGAAPTVLLDASLSLGASGGQWRTALDTARALAGPHGLILRFGESVAPFDTLPPLDGASRLGPALRSAAGRGGPIWVVTDGELDDAAAVPRDLLRAAAFVVLPRDTVSDAALLDLSMPTQIRRDDSLPIALEIGRWGKAADSVVRVSVASAGRPILEHTFTLPDGAERVRRSVVVPPKTLASGDRVLTVRLAVGGDQEPRDDVRQRVVLVSNEPAIVVTVDPPGWEGRFLVQELEGLARAPVRGFAHVGISGWHEMTGMRSVTAGAVRTAVREARLAIIVGRPPAPTGGRPVWRWLAGDAARRAIAGDWYPADASRPSPLGGRLAGIAWDSLPPLTAVAPVAPDSTTWVALVAREGRRGPPRAVVYGRDSAGVRMLTTAGTGLFRWSLRGGAAREAYRGMLAAGVDWLLASGALARAAPITAATVTPRGRPVAFRRAGSGPDTMSVSLAGADSSFTRTLAFGADGVALLSLPVGTYRWRAVGHAAASGLAVVEPYSDEFVPRAVAVRSATANVARAALPVGARDEWWLYAVVIAALVAEWAWRMRRGLP